MEQTISVCMIVKNEEKNIRRVIECAKKFADEIVVVDTGSEDRTPEIARELGAKVYFFEWCDDFSAARNESLKHATCDWIIWLDADDYIDDYNVKRLLEVKKNLPPEKNEIYYFLIESEIVEHKEFGGETWNWLQVRMFPNHPEMRFEGKIHEQITPAAEKLGFKQRFLGIKIIHTGYTSTEKLEEKMKRNVKILEEEERKQPDAWWVKRYLALSYSKLGRIKEAEEKLKKALELIDPRQKIWLFDLYMNLCDIYKVQGKFDDALDILDEAESIDPTEGYVNIQRAEVLFAKERYEEALDELEEARKKGFQVGLIPISQDKIKRKYYIGKARTLARLKKYEDAKPYFEELMKFFPEATYFPEILDDLVECFNRTKNFAKLYEVLKFAYDKGKLPPYHISNLAGAAEKIGKIDEARKLLERAYEEDKENPDIIFNYAHFEFMHGSDPQKVINLFKEYLDIVPPTPENSIYILSALTSIANILIKAGDIKSSVDVLSTACEIAGVKVYAEGFSDLADAWLKISEKFSGDFIKTVAIENAALLLRFAGEQEKEKSKDISIKISEKLKTFQVL